MINVDQTKKNLFLSFIFVFRQSTKFLSKFFSKINGAVFGGNLDPYYVIGLYNFKNFIKNKEKLIEFLTFTIPIAIIAILQLLFLDNLNLTKFFVNIFKIVICISTMLYIKNNKKRIDLYKICKYITFLLFLLTVLALIFNNSDFFWRQNDYVNNYDLKRLQLFYLEPSELGFHISLVIIVLTSLIFKTNDKSLIKKILLLIFINLIPLYFSKAFGAICILLIVEFLLAIYYIIKRPPNVRKRLLIGLSIIIIPIIILFVCSDFSLKKRLVNTLSGQDGSINYRVNVSIDVFKQSLTDYNYLGAGFGNVNTPDFINSYKYLKLDQMIVNSFIYFVTETGILGILYLLILIIYISYECIKKKSVMMTGLLLFIVIYQFLGSHFTNGLIWIIYGFILSNEKFDDFQVATSHKSKKNIMFIVPTLCGGGAEKTVANLSKYLIKDYNIDIVVFKDTDVKYSYDGNLIVLNNKKNTNVFKKGIFFLKALYRIRKLKVQKNIDYSISFLTPADILNVLTKVEGCKTIISIRNTDSILTGGTILKLITKVSCKSCDHIVSISNQVKDDIIDNFGIKKEKITTIYNPSLKIEFSNNQKIDAKLFSDGNTVINVGRLADQKGQWHLIRAFSLVVSEIKNAKLIILGQGPLKDYLQSLIDDYGMKKNVKLLGFVDNPYDYMEKADCFAFSSLYEGLGNSLLEAMACNLPIISCDCISGPREILAPKSDYRNKVKDDIDLAEYGILVPVCDGIMRTANDPLTLEEKLLAEAIIKMLKDKDLIKKYKELSIKRNKDFDINEIVDEWKLLLNR